MMMEYYSSAILDDKKVKLNGLNLLPRPLLRELVSLRRPYLACLASISSIGRYIRKTFFHDLIHLKNMRVHLTGSSSSQVLWDLFIKYQILFGKVEF